MARRIAFALAAAVVTFGVLVSVVIWLGAGFSDRHTTADPVAILPMLDADLGITTPPGVRTVAAREGGFQDRFVQIRLSASQDGFDALLDALDLTRADLVGETDPYLGPEAPDWWAEATGPFLTKQLPSPRLDHLMLAARPDPDDPQRWQLFLWGFSI